MNEPAGNTSLKDLVRKNRSYRRFHQDAPIDSGLLRELVDLGRLSASGGNLQPLKYALSSDASTNELIFNHLAWAAYLGDWPGPREGERPSAYIIILADRDISKAINCDHGIAAQSILLGAVEKGLGGCILGSIRRQELQSALGLSDRYEILLAIALGRPKEEVVIDPVGADGSIKYWRDEKGVHHVPKRALEEIILRK